jgi:hypothetical protein
MGQYLLIDSVDRDLACTQLDELAFAHNGQPWSSLKDALVEWHVRALASARSEAWIPGMAGPQEPVVEEALGRFYSYHVHMAISRLRVENIELRRKIVKAVECARFYANGATDHGKRARSALRDLLAQPATPDASAAKLAPDTEERATALIAG